MGAMRKIRSLTIKIILEYFAIYQIEPHSLMSVEQMLASHHIFSITKTEDELSVICLQDTFQEYINCERQWRALKIINTFPLSSVGVLYSVIDPLVKVGVNIFAISTFNTDYILVQDNKLSLVKDTLIAYGHNVL